MNTSLLRPLGTLRPLLAAAALLAPALASAQVGGALGFRSASGTTDGGQSSDRRGYEARLTYDRELSAHIGWRIEGTINQMQFQRTEGAIRYQVSENGAEALFSMRAEARQGAFAGGYVTAGPVASYRSFCGTSGLYNSNGRVLCDAGEVFRAGYALGIGYRWPYRSTRDFVLEFRYISGVTAAQGKDLVAVSFGVRGKRRMETED